MSAKLPRVIWQGTVRSGRSGYVEIRAIQEDRTIQGKPIFGYEVKVEIKTDMLGKTGHYWKKISSDRDIEGRLAWLYLESMCDRIDTSKQSVGEIHGNHT